MQFENGQNKLINNLNSISDISNSRGLEPLDPDDRSIQEIYDQVSSNRQINSDNIPYNNINNDKYIMNDDYNNLNQNKQYNGINQQQFCKNNKDRESINQNNYLSPKSGRMSNKKRIFENNNEKLDPTIQKALNTKLPTLKQPQQQQNQGNLFVNSSHPIPFQQQQNNFNSRNDQEVFDDTEVMQENYVNNDEEEEYVNFTDDMIPEEGDFSNINNGNNDVNKNKIDFANSNNINYKVYNFPSTNEKKFVLGSMRNKQYDPYNLPIPNQLAKLKSQRDQHFTHMNQKARGKQYGQPRYTEQQVVAGNSFLNFRHDPTQEIDHPDDDYFHQQYILRQKQQQPLQQQFQHQPIQLQQCQPIIAQQKQQFQDVPIRQNNIENFQGEDVEVVAEPQQQQHKQEYKFQNQNIDIQEQWQTDSGIIKQENLEENNQEKQQPLSQNYLSSQKQLSLPQSQKVINNNKPIIQYSKNKSKPYCVLLQNNQFLQLQNQQEGQQQVQEGILAQQLILDFLVEVQKKQDEQKQIRENIQEIKQDIQKYQQHMQLSQYQSHYWQELFSEGERILQNKQRLQKEYLGMQEQCLIQNKLQCNNIQNNEINNIDVYSIQQSVQQQKLNLQQYQQQQQQQIEEQEFQDAQINTQQNIEQIYKLISQNIIQSDKGINQLSEFLQNFQEREQKLMHTVKERSKVEELNKKGEEIQKKIMEGVKLPYLKNNVANNNLIQRCQQQIRQLEEQSNQFQFSLQQQQLQQQQQKLGQNQRVQQQVLDSNLSDQNGEYGLYQQELQYQQQVLQEVKLWISQNRVLCVELESIQKAEEQLQKITQEREKEAQNIQYGQNKEVLKSICSKMNNFQKQIVGIREYYMMKGSIDTRSLYPIQIQQLDGNIAYEQLQTEKHILNIYKYLEGVQQKDIQELQQIVLDSEKTIQSIQKLLHSLLYLPSDDQLKEHEQKLSESIRRLSYVEQHQEQYNQTNKQFVHDSLNCLQKLRDTDKEFQIWKCSCKLREYIEKDHIITLLFNLTLVPQKKNNKQSENMHARFQNQLENTHKALRQYKPRLLEYQDNENAIEIVRHIEAVEQLIDPVYKNYHLMLDNMDPSLEPHKNDVDIWLQEVKQECLHTLQNNDIYRDSTEDYYQGVEKYCENNKKQWEKCIENLTLDYEIGRIEEICGGLRVQLFEYCKFLKDVIQKQELREFFGEEKLSKHLEILQEKFKINEDIKRLKQFSEKIKNKMQTEQNESKVQTWRPLKKKISQLQFIYNIFKSLARILMIVFYPIKEFLRMKEVPDTLRVNQISEDINEIQSLVEQIKESGQYCQSFLKDIIQNENHINTIQQLITQVHSMGKMVFSQLKDFQFLFDQFGKICDYNEQYKGKLCISHEQARQNIIAIYEFQNYFSSLGSSKKMQKLSPDEQKIFNAIQKYLQTFQVQVDNLFGKFDPHSLQKLVEDIKLANFKDCLLFDEFLMHLEQDLDPRKFSDDFDFQQLIDILEEAQIELQAFTLNQDRMDLIQKDIQQNQIFNSFINSQDRNLIKEWKNFTVTMNNVCVKFKNNMTQYTKNQVSYEQLMQPYNSKQTFIQDQSWSEMANCYGHIGQLLELYSGRFGKNNNMSLLNRENSGSIQRENSQILPNLSNRQSTKNSQFSKLNTNNLNNNQQQQQQQQYQRNYMSYNSQKINNQQSSGLKKYQSNNIGF